MPQVAIIGAGPTGASLGHRLAQRSRLASLVFIDSQPSVAEGKALDIRQSGPVEGFDTPIMTTADPLAAASAQVIVVADDSASGAWEGDKGLGLVQRLHQAGATGALVFACPSQVWLMEACVRELGVSANRLIGTAAAAMTGAVRALAGLELGLASVEATVVGRPPAFVVAWSTAVADGSLLTDAVPAHRLAAISRTLGRLWPPGPYALASAAAPIVEGLIEGRRRRVAAMTIADELFGQRSRAVMLPVTLGQGRILARHEPSLSPQERTELATAAQTE